MTVRLKDIKGLLVKADDVCLCGSLCDCVNECIDEQGERSLTLNLEKLANVIKESKYIVGGLPSKIAEDILAALPEILESVKE